MNTHPIEQRRYHRRTRVLRVLLVVPLAVALLGAAYEYVAAAVDARRLPAPGRLVDIGGGIRLHLHCLGRGTPTVVLDASHPATTSSWVWVQPALASRTRVCAYDRAGAGWSDPAGRRRDMATMADELDRLLRRSGEPGPYVFVGHSWGGGVVRLLASRHPEQVAGLALIEAFHPDSFDRRGQPNSTLGGIPRAQTEAIPWLGRIGVFRLVPALLADRADVPGLPDRQRAELRAYLSSAKAASYLAAVERALPTSQAQLRAAGPLGDLPLVVVIGDASDNSSGVGLDLQREILALSSAGVARHVVGADHSSLVHSSEFAARTAEAIVELIERSSARGRR